MKLLRILAIFTSLCAPLWAQSYSFQALEIPGSAETYVFGVNNHNVAVGASYDDDFNALPFTWRNDEFDFPILDEIFEPEFIGINDQGSIVGLGLDQDFFLVSFLLEGDELSLIEFPGADGTLVDRVNNRGEMVGAFIVEADELFAPFYRSAEGDFEVIELEDYPLLTVSDINNVGDMVGTAYSDEFEPTALILRGDEVEIVSHPDGPSQLLAINDNGHVAGYLDDGRSYVFDGTGFHDVVFPGAVDTTIWSINNQGMIGGEYMLAGEDFYRAFVAFPVPEPQSNSLLLLGIPFALCVRRRR